MAILVRRLRSGEKRGEAIRVISVIATVPGPLYTFFQFCEKVRLHAAYASLSLYVSSLATGTLLASGLSYQLCVIKRPYDNGVQ
ncbi:hypothetical protein EI94DRAFT_1284179 [Lactarius quietus]|nr:hypothetical protein EI94DRAFT_1284179 [Lactarius quietus]